MKKIKILILIIGIFLPQTTFASYDEAIEYLKENNIAQGYEDGTFKPENKINRAEFTKIIINSTVNSEEIYGSNCFPDVKEEWFAKYVCTAKRKGIIKGYNSGLFLPAKEISFTEAAKIVTLGYKFNITPNTQIWYQPYVSKLEEKNAKPSTISKTDQKITRGEMAEIIFNLRPQIYQPKPGISWQWQLTGKINNSYNVDLYSIDLETTSKSTIENLQSQGSKVICYFSAGSYENFRDDATMFPTHVLGKKLDGWEDEKWLDISNYQYFEHIMEARLNLAVEKNCDGVEPDNIDAYTNNTGFPLTYKDQLTYNKWLSKEAHKRNLSIALKNDLEQIPDLVNHFDFAINEQCFQYNECETLLPFIQQGKAVLGVEYELEKSEFCKESKTLQFSWLKMNYDLAGEREAC